MVFSAQNFGAGTRRLGPSPEAEQPSQANPIRVRAGWDEQIHALISNPRVQDLGMGACDWPARGRRLFGIEAIHCLQKPFLPKPLPKFGDAIQGPSLPTIRLLKHHDKTIVYPASPDICFLYPLGKSTWIPGIFVHNRTNFTKEALDHLVCNSRGEHYSSWLEKPTNNLFRLFSAPYGTRSPHRNCLLGGGFRPMEPGCVLSLALYVKRGLHPPKVWLLEGLNGSPVENGAPSLMDNSHGHRRQSVHKSQSHGVIPRTNGLAMTSMTTRS